MNGVYTNPFGGLEPDGQVTMEDVRTEIRNNPYGRSRGYWKESRPDVEIEYICSSCRKTQNERTKYCPNCGRLML